MHRGTLIHTLTQRGMKSSEHSLPHKHTHAFMTTNWISSVWRQGPLLWRQQVFRRGDGHRKEGGILSTRSFPLGCPSYCQTKEMDGEKRGGDGDRKQEPLQWQVLRPELPVFHTSSSSLCLSSIPSPPLISFYPLLFIPWPLFSSLPLIFTPSAPHLLTEEAK